MENSFLKSPWAPVLFMFIVVPILFISGIVITETRSWPYVIGSVIIGIWTAAAIKYLRKG